MSMPMSEPTILATVGRTTIWTVEEALYFQAGMAIDADGAPNAYHPLTRARPLSGRPPGLDDLRNAGTPGNWYGIVTESGEHTGEPIVQSETDPYPGYYVSATSLSDRTLGRHNPRRYVDSTKVPFFVLPSHLDIGMKLGDLAMVCHRSTLCGAIYADNGPSTRIGEGSIALATALHLYKGVNNGHETKDVAYLLFPGSAEKPPWPRHLDDIHNEAMSRFNSWGGLSRLRDVAPHLVRGPA